MMTETDWAYLAGLIDGEGQMDILLRANPNTKHIGRGYTREFRLNITNGSRELLVELQQKIGMGSIYLQDVTWSPTHRVKMYSYRFSHNPIRKVLPNIIPYLMLKKKLAVMLLEELDLVKDMSIEADKREGMLLQKDAEFRKECLRTPGNRCQAHRKDDDLRAEVLAKRALYNR